MSGSKHELAYPGQLSLLEAHIVREKASGLSNLEVALKLCLYERDVRAVTQRLKKRLTFWRQHRNGRRHDIYGYISPSDDVRP